MSRLRARLSSTRLQTVLGLTLVPLLVFLLVKSSHTGRAEYEAAEDALGRIEALDLQLNGALFPLLFEFQVDFDALTGVQQQLFDTTSAYAAGQASPSVLFEMVREKIELVEDFKSNQAVMRNSRAIATEMLDDARARPGLGESDAVRDLFAVERSFLDFIGRRDPPSAAQLRATIAEIEASGRPLAEVPEWETFAAHADKLVDYNEQMGMLMANLFMIPLPQQMTLELEALAARFEAQSQTASTYRFLMFATALLLLGFSACKVVQARRYYRLLEQSKAELEERVAARTRQLSDANEALQHEIRDRLTVESQLRIAQKLEAIGQLAAGIAHEINTPMQYVSDNVTFLETSWEDLAPLVDDYEQRLKARSPRDEKALAIWRRADVDYLREEVPAALRAATDGLSQIARIVRAIRDFSHPGDDTLRPENLNHAVQNAATVARNEWKYVAELALDLDETLPKVPCNVSAFNQVILNLIVNSAQAIQSAHTGARLGVIRISTRRDGDCAEILVEDDGPGVPESIRHQIFDPFFTTKEVGKGTGQGLAIAFRVVTKQHGGTLTVGTAPSGRGARFTIRLPLEPTSRTDSTPVGEDADLTSTLRTLELHAGVAP